MINHVDVRAVLYSVFGMSGYQLWKHKLSTFTERKWREIQILKIILDHSIWVEINKITMELRSARTETVLICEFFFLDKPESDGHIFLMLFTKYF